MSPKEQVECIADKFSSVANEYEVLDRSAIHIPSFSVEDIPQFSVKEVSDVLSSLPANKSQRPNDIPAKVFKRFAALLCRPVTNVINYCVMQGVWPHYLKSEIITPVPKVSQPETVNDLRPIANLKNMNKIIEKLVTKLIVEDMKPTLDPAQYANQKGISIQHYLVKMLDRVLSSLEVSSNDKSPAALMTFIDFKEAFTRQDATLGIKSFIENKVRPGLIPLLISFFEDRRMNVRWHGTVSEIRKLNGGGPMGSSIGIWQYLSQTNHNCDNVPVTDRWKFVDDLTINEVINLLDIGLATYNVKTHVPSNLPSHNHLDCHNSGN